MQLFMINFFIFCMLFGLTQLVGNLDMDIFWTFSDFFYSTEPNSEFCCKV